MRKVVIASDSYKGTLGSLQVAAAARAGVSAVWPDAEVLEVEMADGGEGSATALTKALGGAMVRLEVTGPANEPVSAAYGVVSRGSSGAGSLAVIEVAQACGLPLLSASQRHPLLTTTQGVGELLLDAWERGCRQFIVCLGGSGTCDGGAGMLAVPGVKDVLRAGSFVIASDVETLFIDAARVFGPQKGATPEEIPMLEARLARQAEQMLAETGVDVRGLPGSGAAGGLGGAFAAYAGSPKASTAKDTLSGIDVIQHASTTDGSLLDGHIQHASTADGTLLDIDRISSPEDQSVICQTEALSTKCVMRSGVEIVLDAVRFDELIAGADLVITGEGRSDIQTPLGKTPAGVLKRCQASGVPCALVSGSIASCPELDSMGFASITAATPPSMSSSQWQQPAIAASLVTDAVRRLLQSEL